MEEAGCIPEQVNAICNDAKMSSAPMILLPDEMYLATKGEPLGPKHKKAMNTPLRSALLAMSAILKDVDGQDKSRREFFEDLL